MKPKSCFYSQTEDLLKLALKEKVLFPFLFLFHALLVTYTNNFYELRPRQAVRIFSVAIIASFMLYYVLKNIMDRRLAGMLTFLILISVSSFQSQIKFLDIFTTGFLTIETDAYYRVFYPLLAANIGAIGLITFYLNSRNNILSILVKYLNLLFALLTIMALLVLTSLVAGDVLGQSYDNNIELEATSSTDSSIYYIIPDKYTRLEVAREQFDHDYTPFVESMEEKGFEFQRDVYANYDESATAIGSTMNMNYLQDMKEGGTTSHKDVIRILEDNVVQEFLREQGFDYYHVGAVYTEFNKHADKSYDLHNEYLGGKIYLNRYEQLLISNTPLHSPDNIEPYDYVESEKFDQIAEISQKDGQKFVFGHVMSPHRPHTLPKAIEEVEYMHRENSTKEERYNQSLKAVNIKLEETVEEILENEEDPIIIIHGDEGPTLPNDNLKDPKSLERRHGVLFAHHTPNIPGEEFEGKINSVNTFRILFNNEFGTDLSLLEGRSYHTREGSEMEYVERDLSKFVGTNEQRTNRVE